jgi:hypothetical protein
MYYRFGAPDGARVPAAGGRYFTSFVDDIVAVATAVLTAWPWPWPGTVVVALTYDVCGVGVGVIVGKRSLLLSMSFTFSSLLSALILCYAATEES